MSVRVSFRLAFVPLLSLFIFTLGSGLFTTLITVRLHYDAVNNLMIGAMTGFYYGGVAYGSFKIERYLIQVGHIRAFAAFASSLAVVTLLQGLLLNIWLWLLLRFLGGIATAGIYVVIESWLLSVSTTQNRGQMLAFYMIALYAAQALGQFLINFGDVNTLQLFALTAILSSLAVIPLALAKIPVPEITEPSTLKLKQLFSISGSGVMGSFVSGLVLGAIYGLFPLYIMQSNGNASQVALFMALIIFGGMSLQYPLGKLSDILERRLVLLMTAVLTAVLAIALDLFFSNHYLAYVLTFLLGGMAFTLYPLSLSHACDGLDAKDMVSGTQGLLLVYSVGACIGPFIAPAFMHLLGPGGLFIYFVLFSGLLCLFVVCRKAYIPPIPQEENFLALPQTTAVTAELDPRSD